jgi:putative thiamine transport system permease protein
MDSPLRRLTAVAGLTHTLRRLPAWHWLTLLLLILSAGLPMVWAAVAALRQALLPAAWLALLADAQLSSALVLTLWTGLASTVLSWSLTACLLSEGFVRQQLTRWLRALPVMLATPHAAFAIGLVFLLSPSGWLMRLLSPWLTGFAFPPPWPTTQDPWGLSLILALCTKEIPFLLWVAATQLQREDTRRSWHAEHALAQTLGYSRRQAFWRVVWPQLSPRLALPALAVLAYSLTVVDMALVIGPASPPTLAVLSWQWLQDADPLIGRQGAAAGALLLLLVAGSCCLGWLALRLHARWRMHLPGPQSPGSRQGHHAEDVQAERQGRPAFTLLWLLRSLYACVLLALGTGSVAGLWAFPAVWPSALSTEAWLTVWQSSSTLWNSLSLGLVSAALGLLWSVAWLELAPRSWDTRLRPLLYASMLMPGVLWVTGLHTVSLQLGIDGQWPGVLGAHVLMVLPYVMLALATAYQGFDARHAQLSASLGHGRWYFLWRVKWPLLQRALASAFAVGFAVSMAQYLPTLYVGAGRLNTVTTEAVTLAAGAQRSLTSAYAWLQWCLPVVVFALAAWAGRPRLFSTRPTSGQPIGMA